MKVGDQLRMPDGSISIVVEVNPSTNHYAYVEVDIESVGRGGSSRTAACVCGWRGPERNTLEVAADDALDHERASRP